MVDIRGLKLSFVEERVLKNFPDLIEKRIPEAFQIIVFGSRARSISDENSDFDKAIILNTPYVDKKLCERVWDIKWNRLRNLKKMKLPRPDFVGIRNENVKAFIAISIDSNIGFLLKMPQHF